MNLVHWVGPVTMMYIQVIIVNLESVLENTVKLYRVAEYINSNLAKVEA